MRKSKILNRTAALFALMVVLFQSFAFPAMAVDSWSGKSWEGNSWEGNSWEGNPWEGNPWEGNPWEGNSWEGHSWEGNPWNQPGFDGNSWSRDAGQGNSWNGNPWTNNGWNGQGFNGNPWNNQGFHGTPWNMPGYNGNPWNGSGFNGNPWNNPGFHGNPWNMPGYNGNPWNMPGYNGNPWSSNGGTSGGGGARAFTGAESNGPSGYDITKMIVNDYIGGQFGMIGGYIEGSNSFGPAGGYLTGLLLNGVKTGLGDKAPGYVNAAIDLKQGFDMAKQVTSAGQALYDVRRMGQFGSLLSPNAGTFGAVASVSKFSAIGAGISAGFSGYDSVVKWNKANEVANSDARTSEKVSARADAFSSIGETFFNAGIVASAIPVPGAQVVGATMIAGGAALWAVSKVTKLVADNIDTIKSAAKKVGKFFKGLFGK